VKSGKANAALGGKSTIGQKTRHTPMVGGGAFEANQRDKDERQRKRGGQADNDDKNQRKTSKRDGKPCQKIEEETGGVAWGTRRKSEIMKGENIH